ncbi:hypothetical protein LXL04_011331 [Taraxacum kok-saghyz]
MVLRSILFLVVVMLLSSSTSLLMGISGRHIDRPYNRDDDKKGLSSMLPRGIVPPSGPSPCHNMLYHKPTRFPPPPPPFDPSAPPYPPSPTPPGVTPSFPFPFDPPPPPTDKIICP